VIKYGVIASPALFDRVQKSGHQLFAHDSALLTAIVYESSQIKARVVSADERESGPRRALNFGHTIGHALEAVTEYRRFRHGEAVAYGMIGAAMVGAARGVTPDDTVAAIRTMVAALGPLPPVSDLRVSDVLAAVRRDKKVVAGTLHFVAARALGDTTDLTDVTEPQLRRTLLELGLRR
jgi:3-dehydroquinate synthase